MTFSTVDHESALAATSLSRLCATVAVAQGLADSGRAVDLFGLDDAAGRLCAKLLDLPPAHGLRLRPSLEDLQQKISKLATTLATRRL